MPSSAARFPSLFLAVLAGSAIAAPVQPRYLHRDQAFQPEAATVVLLGTGTPVADPATAGPATAIVVRDKVLLFDAGPGVARQLGAANLPINGVAALFLTHLHSDHTLGYPDLIFTTWVMGRRDPLRAYGPAGLQAMTDHVLAAWSQDIAVRTDGLEHGTPRGYAVEVHEIEPGVILEEDGLRVTAFAVAHGSWKKAFGYRIDTPARRIVISGDTAPCEELVRQARGCDVLIHEAYPAVRLKDGPKPEDKMWAAYMRSFHTSDEELGALAARAQAKKLVLHHIVRMGGTDEELLAGVRRGGFTGEVVIGHDLDRY